MGFLKLIMGFFSKLASKGQALMRWLWSKAQDSESGKLKGVNPRKIPTIFTTVAVVTALILLIIHLTKPDMKINTGLSTFEKETAPSSSADYRFEQNGIDPNIDKLPVSTGISEVPKSLVDDVGISASEGLDLKDCLDVLDKMKTAAKLTESETSLANQCIKENPMGMTPDDILLAQKMLDPNTTQAERDFLAKALKDELTPEERNLALALAGTDKEKAELARKAINSGDPELIKLAAKSVSGKELSEEEKSKLASLTSGGNTESAKLDSQLSGNPTSEPSGSKTGVTNEDVEKLSLAVVEGDKNLANKAKEIEKAKQDAQDVADKIKRGSELGESEVKRLQNLTTKQKELDALKKLQEANKKSLADKMAKLKETIQRSMVTVGGKNIPTGVFVEYEGEDQCTNKVKPFVAKKPVKPKVNYVDLDNRPLNPEEVEYIKLMRKGGTLAKAENQDKSIDFISKLGEPMQLVANGDTTTNIEQMIVFSDKGIKDCELTSDMLIPGQLDSEILTSSNGGSQQVRMKILMDIYCPTSSHQLLIPKGAIAIAQSGGFDADTGIMTMNVDKVTAGGKNLSFRFAVASANGASGLRGEVRDTTGKYLIGAFIPAFAGAALSYFSQQTVQPFLQSTNAQQAITGAALAGSAEVMNKIAELAASKMLNAPKIFWVPKGIPVVLIPQ